MNPLKHLIPTLYTTLTVPPLVYDGVDIKVYEHPDSELREHYVFLQQPTFAPTAGSTGCRAWECTALIDVITQFPADQLSSEPADELADQITNRLDNVALPMPAGWQCGRGITLLGSELREDNGELRAVRRLLRYRWSVYYHGGTYLQPLPPVYAAPTGRYRAVS
ncbi:hypothetical protein MUN82_08710 [Hymenobacter aerilatus]|uniref:Uncharacterized protein n=1 Tax=Hymenobacter aerilatus TaxID=2932251 RepID=A0A8T9T2H1_9BACT|nr:hypothetical protein [Hymenobacter aerilatus]UOR07163.1 hypothetical protein MUN82_08710 [Hymenobacter aerilatus]